MVYARIAMLSFAGQARKSARERRPEWALHSTSHPAARHGLELRNFYNGHVRACGSGPAPDVVPNERSRYIQTLAESKTREGWSLVSTAQHLQGRVFRSVSVQLE